MRNRSCSGAARWISRGLLATAAVVLPARTSEAASILQVDDDLVQCPTAAFTTIQAAVAAALPGDTIEVCPGTYVGPVTLASSLLLHGARFGVDARGRVVGAPDPLVESIITGAGVALVQLQAGSAGSVVDGFTISGGTRGIESSGGPLDGLAILNNHIGGFSNAGVFLNDPGIDITVGRNVIDGTSKTGGGGLLHLDQDLFPGFHLTENWIQNSTPGTGFFVDGTRNVRVSATPRSPAFVDNLFFALGTGANIGRKAVEFAEFRGNVFRNNLFDGLQGGPADSRITENHFVDNGRSGLSLTGFGGGTDPIRGAQRNVVDCNRFTGNAVEGVFFTATQFAGTISTNLVNDNVIEGNTVGATYLGTETIDVQDNWWGDASGPTHATNPGGSGDVASGATLDVVPFLAAIPTCAPPPVLTVTCPPDVEQECDDPPVSLDFTVFERNGFGATVTIRVDGNVEAVEVIPGGPPPTNETVSFTFAYSTGTSTVEATVESSVGDVAVCSLTVTIDDSTAPTVTCDTSKATLWPATKGLVDVGLTASASDTCDPAPARTVEVYSDEGNGAPPYSPDALVSGSQLKLRAERAVGPGADGRIYLIVVRGTDASGGTGVGCCTVVVPLNLTTGHLTALAAEAASVEAAFKSNQTPPPGYVALTGAISLP